MAVSPSLSILLGNSVLRDVFKAVVSERTIRFKDLRESFQEGQIDPVELKASLRQLQDVELIKELPASIDDFATYYVTADGLTAERELKRAEPSSQPKPAFARRD